MLVFIASGMLAYSMRAGTLRKAGCGEVIKMLCLSLWAGEQSVTVRLIAMCLRGFIVPLIP